jgi:hypothetical protein
MKFAAVMLDPISEACSVGQTRPASYTPDSSQTAAPAADKKQKVGIYMILNFYAMLGR